MKYTHLRRRYLLIAIATAAIVAALCVLLLRGHRTADTSYAAFSNCPLSNPLTDICIFTKTEGGQLIIGSKTIPISRTLTLEGGIHQSESSKQQELIVARGRMAFSTTPQPVAGGILNILSRKLLPNAFRRQLDRLIERGITQVTATPELATSSDRVRVNTQNLIEAKGIGLSLPLKVKLTNPFLGAHCYIGSDSHPILMALTTGSTHASSGHGSIHGKPGHAEFKDEYSLVTLTKDSLVSDSFAAPRVEGCGAPPSALVDSAVNAGLGLPVAAGGNEAILNGTIREANAPAVRAANR